MTDEAAAALDRSRSDRGSTIHIGRYALHRQIARGGMATIHIARLVGDEGFSRIVAAKRLLPELAEDAEFVAMFLDEARIASRVRHRNVVPVLDVVTTGDETVLVQEYVHGVPLHWLLHRARQAGALVPVDIAVAIACQVLSGLHAAHEMTDELGKSLGVVHRDVSPQNVMIATDGTARLLDFGVAKSLIAAHVTREGTYKGKLAYSAPEQLRGAAVRQSDIYSLAVLLWEVLVGHRMHRTAQAEAELVATIMNGRLPTISEALVAQGVWESIDEQHRQQLVALEPILERGLACEIGDRFQTAAEMEEALLSVVRPASGTAIAQWLRGLGKEYMDRHDKALAAEEASWRRSTGAQAQPGPRRPSSPTVPMRPSGPRLGGVPGADEPPAGAGAGATTSASTPRVMPNAPPRAPHVLVALLSLLVVALALGIIIVVVRGQAKPAPVAPAPAASPADLPAAAPVPAPAARPVGPPAAARADRAGAPAAAPAPAISIGEVETSPTAAQAAPKRSSSRSAASSRRTERGASQPRAAARPKTTALEPPPAEPRPPAKDSCNPPYYFEGTKKIFKPACL
jgi:serine/threonine-protein kinase